MAKYRQVHLDFWQDSFVLDLAPEEKFFYLYLLTNSKTTQCGIYELPLRVAEIETGYTKETLEKYIQRFVDYGKIQYSKNTKEIMVQNWCKWNFSNSPKVQMCIKKELEKVKETKYINDYLEQVQKFGYSIDTVSIDLGEKEKEKEKKDIVHFENAPQLSEPILKEKIINMKESKQEGYSEEFELFWNEYKNLNPKGKKEAYKKFNRCLKEYGIEVILQGTKGYATEIKKLKTESQFVKMAKTYLNNDSFNDYLSNTSEPPKERNVMKKLGGIQ